MEAISLPGIEIVPTQVHRAFGWVQDPSNFRSLCKVVALFSKESSFHSDLVEHKIPRLVEERDGRDRLLSELTANVEPLRISYHDLIGTSFTPRSESRCNGIVQAAIKGQKRDFIGDWPADNYVRWAHALGFITYHYSDDTFSITAAGNILAEQYVDNEVISDGEKEILISAMITYPPALRVLSLLSEPNAHLTKFEIGRQLGFIGEGGFTSVPQDLLVLELARTDDPKIRKDMKSDWEGSSDKYARMIAKWLANLGLVEITPKEIQLESNGEVFRETISQAYRITASGLRVYQRARGRSRHPISVKNVYYEIFSPSGDEREYLRTRRSHIVSFINRHRRTTITDIQNHLRSVGIEESSTAISDDVNGLIKIGLDVVISGQSVQFRDRITDFQIPIINNRAAEETDLSRIKESTREKLDAISHDYLSLIDIAYTSSQNRLFEMKSMELFINEYGFRGRHLGGARKPDGVIYSDSLNNNYGVIVDTKAYSGGYPLPISQADEMTRYIRENQNRDEIENPNRWWGNFPADLTEFKFLFVSGHFKGNYVEQLQRIARTTRVNGGALSVVNMLLCANMIKRGEITLEQLRTDMFQNREYTVT